MQLDKEKKFNFFTKSQQKKLRAVPVLGAFASISLFTLLLVIIYLNLIQHIEKIQILFPFKKEC